MKTLHLKRIINFTTCLDIVCHLNLCYTNYAAVFHFFYNILFLPFFASNQLFVCKPVLGIFEDGSRTEVNCKTKGCPGRPGKIGSRSKE